MTLPEWILQQLVAYIPGLSLKLSHLQACMCTLQEALTALGHLHCIQTLRLRTEPGQEAVMRDISQENRNVIAASTGLPTRSPSGLQSDKPSPEKQEPGSVSPDRAAQWPHQGGPQGGHHTVIARLPMGPGACVHFLRTPGK